MGSCCAGLGGLIHERSGCSFRTSTVYCDIEGSEARNGMLDPSMDVVLAAHIRRHKVRFRAQFP